MTPASNFKLIMSLEEGSFHELSFYTLAHDNQKYFIHQHVVDAFAAQEANDNTKPIKVIFALVGLYLFIEKGYSGREVQKAHMRLAEHKGNWPSIELPLNKGNIQIEEVLKENPGESRDKKIKEWCESIWKSYYGSREIIASLLNNRLGI